MICRQDLITMNKVNTEPRISVGHDLEEQCVPKFLFVYFNISVWGHFETTRRFMVSIAN